VIVEENEIKSIVLSDGTDLYYELKKGTNGRTPIVFVHGWTGSGEDWTNLVAHYTAQGDSCLTYDAAGFGKSQFPSKSVARHTDFSIARYNADLLALLNAENLDKVRLVGHSWGGVVAMAFAAKYPERVESLLTVGRRTTTLMRGCTFCLSG
jgi:pimeloyl-ACP methyl ester carboxylesterase